MSRITDVKTIRVVLTVCMSGPDREKEENNDDDKRKRREEEMRKKKSNGTSSKLELACRETPFAIKRWKPREVLKRIQRQQQPTHTRLDENNKKNVHRLRLRPVKCRCCFTISPLIIDGITRACEERPCSFFPIIIIIIIVDGGGPAAGISHF